MVLNVQKTEVIVFGKDPVPDPDIYFRGDKLKVVQSFRYLGVIITSDNKWTVNTQTLLSQARKASMALRKKTNNFLFSPADKYLLFGQLVEPILSYGSEVWGHGAAVEMEKFHKNYMREFLE